jgi:ubiquinone/menaquinone biosynthesis C-methylase UbiE
LFRHAGTAVQNSGNSQRLPNNARCALSVETSVAEGAVRRILWYGRKSTMAKTDTAFSGAIAQFYDQYFGYPLFGPHAEKVALRVAGLSSGSVLEVAAGTGIATAILAQSLPADVEVIATDLNQPMLDFAATKPELSRVTCRQADATALPFPDDSFDAVICQFGVMFYPNRRKGHAEAYRVLKPGGRYVFNVWDRIALTPIFEIVHETVAGLYPAHPPGFIARTPCGYHDEAVIKSDLRASGFEDQDVEMVEATWSAASVRDPAVAFCQGSPLRAEIEAVDPDGLDRATQAVTEAIVAHLNGRPPAFPTRALLFEAVKRI